MQRNLSHIQSFLKQNHYDGWLIYDYRKNNPYAVRLLSLEQRFPSRRLCYWIPREGSPVKIIHRIETHILNHLEGESIPYRNNEEFHHALKMTLQGSQRIVMEFSPLQAIPAVSVVDGGLIDLVRTCGVEVLSSADLLTLSIAILSEKQLQSHHEAAEFLDDLVLRTWKRIGNSIKENRLLTEYDIQQWMLEQIDEGGFVTDHPPICAVNAHSANPHYAPEKDRSSTIKAGDWILLDVWCKKKNFVESVFADITRVAVAGQPTDEQLHVHRIVRQAQVAAIDFLREKLKNQDPVEGWMIDRAAYKVLKEAGYAECVLHRTGHNIFTELHGPGAHFDNFETKDTRKIFPNTCYSVEPGIYLPGQFGVRLETDVFIDAAKNVLVTGGEQDLPFRL